MQEAGRRLAKYKRSLLCLVSGFVISSARKPDEFFFCSGGDSRRARRKKEESARQCTISDKKKTEGRSFKRHEIAARVKFCSSKAALLYFSLRLNRSQDYQSLVLTSLG